MQLIIETLNLKAMVLVKLTQLMHQPESPDVKLSMFSFCFGAAQHGILISYPNGQYAQ